MRGTEGEPVADARRLQKLDVYLAGVLRSGAVAAGAGRRASPRCRCCPRSSDAPTTASYIQAIRQRRDAGTTGDRDAGRVPAASPRRCSAGSARARGVGLSRQQAVRFDVAIVGAGAAGLLCAAMAGQRGLRVLLIDHAEKVAEKIRISGGGRCNFTNRDDARRRNFHSRNPDFCRSALARYTPRDFIDLVAAPRHRAGTRSTAASCSATTRASRSSTCCWPNATAGGVDRWQPCRVDAVARSTRDGFALRDEPRRGRRRRARGRGHRRPVDPQDRRHRLRLSRLARQFGHRDRRAAPGAGAARLRRAPTGRRSRRSPACRCRCAIAPATAQAARALRRGPALHAPRPERPGGAADLELLAPGEALHDRPRARGADWHATLLAPRRRPRASVANDARRRTCRSASPMPGCARRPAWRRPLADCRDSRCASSPQASHAWRIDAQRHRGLPQGRGHGRRRRHARARLADAGSRRDPGPALHRRSGRRHRLARRLQLPVGLGQRRRLRPGAGESFAGPGAAGYNRPAFRELHARCYMTTIASRKTSRSTWPFAASSAPSRSSAC